MGRPYSMDLRERVVAAIEGGLSRRQAAAHFGVSYSAAIEWMKRLRETGSVAPGQMGGQKPKKISGEHRTWLVARCSDRAFTLHGLVAELGERGLAVDYRLGLERHRQHTRCRPAWREVIQRPPQPSSRKRASLRTDVAACAIHRSNRLS